MNEQTEIEEFADVLVDEIFPLAQFGDSKEIVQKLSEYHSDISDVSPHLQRKNGEIRR